MYKSNAKNVSNKAVAAPSGVFFPHLRWQSYNNIRIFYVFVCACLLTPILCYKLPDRLRAS